VASALLNEAAALPVTATPPIEAASTRFETATARLDAARARFETARARLERATMRHPAASTRPAAASGPDRMIGSRMPIAAIVFDLGGVLLDWDPRYLYRKLFPGEEARMRYFLENVCTPAWNNELDRGRPFTECIAAACRKHPEWSSYVHAYRERWIEMVPGPVTGSVEVLDELRRTGVRLFVLSNFSAETFPLVRPDYAFFGWFEGIVLSGEEGLVKPDPAIFRRLVERHRVDPPSTVFIDDNANNVESAAALGFQALRFTTAIELRRQLQLRQVLTE
jgi:2-haloacid dehalogenase